MKYNKLFLLLYAIGFFQFSCKKILEIDSPVANLEQKSIFKNDALATSTMLGIYQNMAISGYASGFYASVTSVGGLSSDELVAYNPAIIPFYQNQINPDNNELGLYLFAGPYKSIYSANAILEGLAGPNGVTPPIKLQLEGEARFIRAFSYFYLVNMFGPVPLHLTTDYRVNQIAFRAPTDKVYEQIITDLKVAEGLLTNTYITNERVRPNRATVQALLARVYLYTRDWVNADKYSSLILDNQSTYSLQALDNVFLKNSLETIWQLMPPANTNTKEGAMFILQSAPTLISLRNTFAVSAFEVADKRQTSWVKSFTNVTGTYYYPFKYKIKSSSIVSEYSVVFRLAEQYLIRSEARAELNNLDGSIADLDIIRNRAEIVLIRNVNPGISKQDLLSVIYNERKIELFSEWGHRWFDLKRTGRANSVLIPLKSNWQATDILYPIPTNEISRNSNISPNEGY